MQVPLRSVILCSLLGAWLTACGPSQPSQSPEGTPAPTTTPTHEAVETEPETTPDKSPDTTPTTETPADTGVLTAAQLAAGIEPGDHQLEAFVLELRPCPACPPPMTCRPCLGDFAVISDAATPPANGAAPSLRLKPGQVQQLEAGKRYRFELKAIPRPGAPSATQVQVVSITPIP